MEDAKACVYTSGMIQQKGEACGEWRHEWGEAMLSTSGLVALEWGRHIWLEGKSRGEQAYLWQFQGKWGNEGVNMR